jgi:hypothetical protein
MLQEALAGLRLKVTVDGTVYDSDLRPGDLVRYEEHTGRSLFGLNGDDAEKAQQALDRDTDEGTAEAAAIVGRLGLGMSDLFYLAYLGVRRQATFADFDDFLDRVSDIAIGAEEEVPKAV